MHLQFTNQHRLESLTLLVYWYGSERHDIANCYSFVQQKHFIPYEVAAKEGNHTVPASIQKKVDSNKKLTDTEKVTFTAYEEMEEDLAKEPVERVRGVTDFK